MDIEETLFPKLSIAERDRRWRSVRAMMAEQGLAAIVAPPNTGHSTDFQASSRYLSGCGGGADAEIAVIFPAAGEVTVAATSAVSRWGHVQDWVSDLREADDDYGSQIIGRLRELGVAGQRVGVVGLGAGTRTAEGIIAYQTMRRMRRELPSVTWVDATPILEAARLVKSDEEIDCLRRSMELIDRAYETEVRTAKAGTYDYVVWGEVRATMLRGGSEPTLHCNWISGPKPLRTLTRPSHRQLERGDIIFNELESSWAGYRAQGVQPVAVETCDPMYHELLKIQAEVFGELLGMLRPGVTLGELAQACRESCLRHRPSTGPTADAVGTLIMHGRGMGDDGPILTNSALDPRHLRTPLQANMAFIFKPQVNTLDKRYPVNWGDTVFVTPQGGQRLGTRPFGVLVSPPA